MCLCMMHMCAGDAARSIAAGCSVRRVGLQPGLQAGLQPRVQPGFQAGLQARAWVVGHEADALTRLELRLEIGLGLGLGLG